MGFTIDGTPTKIWMPVINTDTLYVGQIVTVSDEGIVPLVAATGPLGAANRQIPYGIVVGTNKRVPAFDSTQMAEYVTYVSPVSATAEDYAMVEGVWAKGDLQAMAEIALIDQSTIIKGPLFNGANPGTAPTESTLSGTPDTVSATSGTTMTGLASLATIYFRTGKAEGCYRITDDTSTTALTWDLPVKTAAVSGDKVCRVPLRTCGKSRMQVGTECVHINTGASLGSAYFGIEVLELNLKTAGNEYCRFRFSAEHFQAERWLEGSEAWDVGSINDHVEEMKEVTVTGAALGDFAIGSADGDVIDLQLNACVTGTNTVTIVISNSTGGALDASAIANVYARVLKK